MFRYALRRVAQDGDWPVNVKREAWSNGKPLPLLSCCQGRQSAQRGAARKSSPSIARPRSACDRNGVALRGADLTRGKHPGHQRTRPRHKTMRHWITSFRSLIGEPDLEAPPLSGKNKALSFPHRGNAGDSSAQQLSCATTSAIGLRQPDGRGLLLDHADLDAEFARTLQYPAQTAPVAGELPTLPRCQRL
jgi:hypothetical protein